MESGPVYTLILPVKPAGKRPPYIIDTCDLPGTEEVFLDESHGVLNLLSEYSDKKSYPQFFIIRTF